jgi:hypothetical protein
MMFISTWVNEEYVFHLDVSKAKNLNAGSILDLQAFIISLMACKNKSVMIQSERDELIYRDKLEYENGQFIHHNESERTVDHHSTLFSLLINFVHIKA